MTGPDAESPTNIGPDGQRFRLFIGVIAIFFTFGLAALLTVTAMPLPLRLAVFAPAWISAICLLQARGSTCVFLAARGARATEGGVEKIEDRELAQRLLQKSQAIHWRALAAAAAFAGTLIAAGYLLPWRFPPAL